MYSILYPVIGNPPLFDGADQDRFIWVPEFAVATNPVGALGAPEVEDDVGIADASAEAAPVPMLLMAEILYV